MIWRAELYNKTNTLPLKELKSIEKSSVNHQAASIILSIISKLLKDSFCLWISVFHCVSECVNEQSDKHSYYDPCHHIARPELQPLEATTAQHEMFYSTEELSRNQHTLLQEPRGEGGTVEVLFLLNTPSSLNKRGKIMIYKKCYSHDPTAVGIVIFIVPVILPARPWYR